MIKIIHATHVDAMVVELRFSDGSVGTYDFASLLAHDTVLTRALAEPDYFRSFFLELGALAWSNGLELSGGALHEELLRSRNLRWPPSRSAHGE
jgi:hypothetical protein